jgi:hypothetical protein
MLASDLAGEGDVIQVVSRAFDVLRCFEGHEARLGNLEISNRCGLPRSTVSRLTHTLTRMGQLVYLPRDQKYRIGPERGGDEHLDDEGAAAAQSDPPALAGCRRTIAGHRRLRHSPTAFIWSISNMPAQRTRSACTNRPGSRIAMASTAAGHAYTAALDVDVGDALIHEMEREMPDSARMLKSRIEGNRRHSARTRLCRRLRHLEPAYQRLRRAVVVAAISDLCGGDDRIAVGDVR